jgi:hypothetical protein
MSSVAAGRLARASARDTIVDSRRRRVARAVSLCGNQNRRTSIGRQAMRPIEIAVVLVITGLALSWIGPLAWALLRSAAMFAY